MGIGIGAGEKGNFPMPTSSGPFCWRRKPGSRQRRRTSGFWKPMWMIPQERNWDTAWEHLLRAGAKDACCIPIGMKKSRPAFLLQAICDEEHREALENLIFRETTSIGFRRYRQARRVLPGKSVLFESSLGPVRIKYCRHLDQTFAYPEYEDAAELAEKTGKPFREVMDLLKKEAAEGIR